jgi:hypothetical protein
MSSTPWWPTASGATRGSPRGSGTADDLLGEVYGDVTDQQLPVARFSLWAHLRALEKEGRAVPVDADAGTGDTIETRWAAA